MAQGSHTTPICFQCQEPSERGDLVSSARNGSLESVCERCFLLREISALCVDLGPREPAREIVLEGIRTLYEVLRTRTEELLLSEVV